MRRGRNGSESALPQARPVSLHRPAWVLRSGRGLATDEDVERLERDVGHVQAWFNHKPTHESIKESQKITSISVLAFSDCIDVCVPIQSEFTKHEGDFDVLMSELTSFAMAQRRCAVNGIFLRRGIDFGIWYKRKDTLISPVMVKSYHLE